MAHANSCKSFNLFKFRWNRCLIFLIGLSYNQFKDIDMSGDISCYVRVKIENMV